MAVPLRCVSRRPLIEVCHASVRVNDATILACTDLTVQRGEVVAVTGPSGSGKTTLLNCLSGIVVPSEGDVIVDGVKITALTSAARARFRRTHLGIVFQDAELLDELTVLDNVAVRLRFDGMSRHDANEEAKRALHQVGMARFASLRIATLSGGEAQRIAVARAIAGSPVVILADEPTASLDKNNAQQVAGLLVDLAHRHGIALVAATHDPVVAGICDRQHALRESDLVT